MSVSNQVKTNRIPQTDKQVLYSIRERFSPRVFSPEDISNEILTIMFEAARWAPSGRNHQPWQYFIARRNKPSFDKMRQCIPERNGWALSAPIIIVSCYYPHDPDGQLNKWAQYDLGASVISLILQAQKLKYYARQIGSFYTDKVKDIFRLPDNLIPFTLIAMGKIGTDSDYAIASKEYVDKDLTPTGRKTDVWKEL